MAHKLQVAFWHGPFHPAWENLINQLNWSKFEPEDRMEWIDTELAKFNGRNLRGTDYIEFNTEADANLFLLRWS